MPIRNCLDLIINKNSLPEEDKKFILNKSDEYKKKNISEDEADRKALTDYHKKLHDDLNKLKKSIGVKQSAYSPIDKNIAEINKKYEAQKEEIKNNLLTQNQTENAIREQSASSVLQHPQSAVGETGSERGRMEPSEQGNETTGTRIEHPKEESQNKGEEENVNVHAEYPRTILTHRGLQEVSTEISSEDITPRERESRLAQLKEADNTISDWQSKGTYTKNINDIIDRATNGHIDEVEQKILANHLATLREERRAITDKNSKAFKDKTDEIIKVINAAKIMRSKAGGLLGDKAFGNNIPKDYSSPDSIIEAKENATGKSVAALPEEIKSQSEKIKNLEEQNQKLQQQLKDALDTGKGTKKTYTEKAKSVADRFRKLKTKPFTFKDGNGNEITLQIQGITWNDLVELGAKAIEKTGEIADGITAILDKIKDADWYVNLSDNDKNKFQEQLEQHYIDNRVQTKEEKLISKSIKAKQKELYNLKEGIPKQKSPKRELTDKEKELQDEILDEKEKLGLVKSKVEKPLTEQKQIKSDEDELQNLAIQFADKKDNKFTPQQSSDIWDYAKKTYIDNNPNFKVVDMVNNLSMDLGLTPEQVRNALATTPQTRKITDQIYRNQYEKNKAHKTIENWVNKTDKPVVNGLLDTISAPFRGLATLGHGHALLFTHAGWNLFDWQIAKQFFIASARQFKLVYGDAANYEKAKDALKSDPLYTTALKNGAAIDPDNIYDDWQLANNFLKKLKILGNKGFLVLKMMRFELFKNEYNHLSAIEKADPKVLKQVAENANHWTGTAGLKVSPTANAFIFAPNLIVSKFARLTTDPVKALITLQREIRGKNVSLEDKAATKIIAKKTGRIIATYVGALVANQALLSIIGSKQSINFTHPTKSDWLKFKTGDELGDHTVDVSGGMVSTLQFLTQLAILPFEEQKETASDYYSAKTANDALNNEVTGFMRRMLSPFASTAWDIASHKDFAGNVLPIYSDKPQRGRIKLSPIDYIAEKIPIPLAETYKTIHDEMVQNGASELQAQQVIGGIIIGAFASAGIKIGNEPKQYIKN